MIVTNSYRNKFRALRSILVLLIFVAPCLAFAQAPIATTNLSDQYFRMGNGIGMGGAYRAVANSPAAVIYNPAGIALMKGKMMASGDYAYSGEVSSHVYGVAVVDAQTSPVVSYGLSYHRFSPTIGGVSGNVNQTIIAAAYSLGNFLQLGISGKGYWVSLDSPILQGPRGLDMDLGAILRPLPILAFAVTGYNLARGGTIEEFPRMLGFGGALMLEPHAKLSFDVVNNFNTPSTGKTNYYMGADLRAAESTYVRGGFAFDNVAHNNYYSVGGALVGPMAELMFTFSQRLAVTSETYAVSAAFKF